MLTFEQKLEILESFPQLERRNVSLKRVNFHYEQSVYDKKTVAFHIHPNGNGFIYAGLLEGYETDDKGFVNIRDYSEAELRELVEKSIRSLSGDGSGSDKPAGASASPATADQTAAVRPQTSGGLWTNDQGQILTLKYEDDLWYIFAGESLEMAFETREEAGEYLAEEGFAPQKG
ncbi:hypothetical protein AWM70_01000 [Paenibacillus yonginensis]|uniref:Uncharacterized protein n=1 Tax=Paenibacillus yonginensis TaxID=1462996 RepID=A0A1B1MW03_9BACL|nr:hypothetical protein [Paenibacillus yonginensis]ANS73335.1 hypothetical protein AWM70_01000 [Paenibacillus yonginensis]